jgi:hypothetical protein
MPMLEVYGDFDLSPYSYNSANLILVARASPA